jgi:hypothetical protein
MLPAGGGASLTVEEQVRRDLSGRRPETMLSLQDCLDMAEVTESEIAAIARHEHIPPIVALELGHHLLRLPGGQTSGRLERQR